MSKRLKWSLAAVLFLFVAVLPQFISSDYYMHLLIVIMMNAVLAMTFIILLRAGMLNMSIAAFWGIGAYSSAMLTLKGGLSFWAALPVSIVIAACVAALFGAIIVRYSGLGFIMPSLIFGFIVPLVFATFKVFGGRVGLIRIPPVNTIPLPGGADIVFGSTRSYYYLLLVFAVVVIVVTLALYRAWTGRVWRAMGLSTDLAQSVGISLFRYRLLGFVICSAMAALMGVFFAHYSTNIMPESYGVFKVIYVQMYAILGGVAAPILGPIIGAGVLVVIPELLRVTKGFEPMITGAIIILILIFVPQGIMGLFQGRSSSDVHALLARAFGYRLRRQQPAPSALPTEPDPADKEPSEAGSGGKL
ncbi:MAG: branched-chain amino acid ABC transporter permease [Thermoleophilia bacterium]|nr:branched-chain amino acid ABC transporter permease [Thermoleophilia bacterium]